MKATNSLSLDNEMEVPPEPSILLHFNIPKPLHGLNPRVIMGQEWWDIERRKAYQSTNFHCLACGVEKSNAIIHQWLEAHEYYNFAYDKGILSIEKIVPLCHACHNYIHNGRLKLNVLAGDISTTTFWKIVKHGTDVLQKVDLPNNPFMLAVLNDLDKVFTFPSWAKQLIALDYELPRGGENIAWEDWRLSFNGKLYSPIHKSYEEWHSFYSSGGKG